MSEFEKVIAILERCWKHGCDKCDWRDGASGYPWSCPLRNQAEKAAIELLKAQMPRVMTLDEIMKNGGEAPIYLECLDVVGVTPVIYQPDDFEDGYLAFSGSWRNSGYYHGMNYGKKWRCWTARPSDEQRKAVKWDD